MSYTTKTELPNNETMIVNYDTMSITIISPDKPAIRGQLAAFGVPTPENSIAMRAAHLLAAECQVPAFRIDEAYSIVQDAINEALAQGKKDFIDSILRDAGLVPSEVEQRGRDFVAKEMASLKAKDYSQEVEGE